MMHSHVKIKPSIKFTAIFIGILALATIIFIALSYRPPVQRDLFDNEYAYDASNSLSWMNDPHRLSYQLSVENITLEVNFNNGTIDTHLNLSFSDHYTTAFDCVALHYSVIYKIRTMSEKTAYYISTIDNIQENLQSGYYWQFYVNNHYAQVGANLYGLRDGDIITWIYTDALISA